MGVVGVSPPAAGVRDRQPRKNKLIMRNYAFWCILGSEIGQLLTDADPEGTAKGEVGWQGGDAEGIDVRGAEGSELKILKASRGGEWEIGSRLPNRLRSLGSVVSPPAGSGAETWPTVDFSA